MKYGITLWGHSTFSNNTNFYSPKKAVPEKKYYIAGVLKSEISNFYTYFILEIAFRSKLNLDMLMER